MSKKHQSQLHLVQGDLLVFVQPALQNPKILSLQWYAANKRNTNYHIWGSGTKEYLPFFTIFTWKMINLKL